MAVRITRHQGPITYRPTRETGAWLDDIAAREGRQAVRAVISEAVDRARSVDEAGLAAFDREQTRAFMAWVQARNDGKDASEELAALNAVMDACKHAISQQEPRREGR